MKIKKNLSDADMFRGSREEYSFETDVLEDGPRRKQFKGVQKPAPAADMKVSALPDDVQERLNRCVLEASMDWLRQGGGETRWSIQRNGVEITLKLVPDKVWKTR